MFQYVSVQSQEYNSDQLFQARALILGLIEPAPNNILPIRTGPIFDLSKSIRNFSKTNFLSSIWIFRFNSELISFGFIFNFTKFTD